MQINSARRFSLRLRMLKKALTVSRKTSVLFVRPFGSICLLLQSKVMRAERTVHRFKGMLAGQCKLVLSVLDRVTSYEIFRYAPGER